jgi:hypothetical protein
VDLTPLDNLTWSEVLAGVSSVTSVDWVLAHCTIHAPNFVLNDVLWVWLLEHNALGDHLSDVSVTVDDGSDLLGLLDVIKLGINNLRQYRSELFRPRHLNFAQSLFVAIGHTLDTEQIWLYNISVKWVAVVDSTLLHVLWHTTDTEGWEELLVLVWLKDIADSINYLFVLVVLSGLMAAR